MLDAVNSEVALEMANACTYDELPAFAREHFDYASRISFPFADGGRSGTCGGSADRDAGAPPPSEERLQWLMKELRDL